MPPKLCQCISHGCRKALDTNGKANHPPWVWKKHQDDDRLANLTEEFSAAKIRDSGVQQLLETAHREVIQSQEVDIVASLVWGRTYPLTMSNHAMPGQQSLLCMEEIEVRLQRHIRDTEELAIPGLQRSAGSVLKDLHEIGSCIRINSSWFKRAVVVMDRYWRFTDNWRTRLQIPYRHSKKPRFFGLK